MYGIAVLFTPALGQSELIPVLYILDKANVSKRSKAASDLLEFGYIVKCDSLDKIVFASLEWSSHGYLPHIVHVHDDPFIGQSGSVNLS